MNTRVLLHEEVSMCSTLDGRAERWNPTREHHEFQQETFKLLHHWMTLMSRQIGQLSWLGFKYKKSQDLEEVLNWMIFYLQYIWQLNKHHDLTSIFSWKKICMNFQCKILLGIWGFSLALIFLVITFSIDWCCSRIILCWRSIIGILRLHKCLLSKVDFFWRSIRFQ